MTGLLVLEPNDQRRTKRKHSKAFGEPKRSLLQTGLMDCKQKAEEKDEESQFHD